MRGRAVVTKRDRPWLAAIFVRRAIRGTGRLRPDQGSSAGSRPREQPVVHPVAHDEFELILQAHAEKRPSMPRARRPALCRIIRRTVGLPRRISRRRLPMPPST